MNTPLKSPSCDGKNAQLGEEKQAKISGYQQAENKALKLQKNHKGGTKQSPSVESSISIPFLVIDRPNLLLPAVEINKHNRVGVMTHACTSRNFRRKVKDLNLVKICDSGVFLKASNQQDLSYGELFHRYEEMKANYGIIFDVLGDAIATVKTAKEAIRIYGSISRSFNLIGVVQGQTVKDYQQCAIELINLGYRHLAIGGMLRKHDKSARYVKVKNDDFLIEILKAVREV